MPNLALEQRLQQQGFRLVAGVDEAGRGPLAGPVVAAAVILSPGLSESEPWLKAVDDSKRLSPARRERALELVQQHALAIGVAQVGPAEIDGVGINQANVQAMLGAIASLPVQPEYLLLDFVRLRECAFLFDLVVRGDSLSYSIAAASIVAKVTRDRLMQQVDALYPGYSFTQNKGYATAKHLAQLRMLGPCPIHRRSFAPVQQSPQPSLPKEIPSRQPFPRNRPCRLSPAPRRMKVEPPLPLWERIEVRGITPILTFPHQGGRELFPKGGTG